MCGIIGHINTRSKINHEQFVRMRDTLIHRGPDDADAKFFNNDSIALGHRRLSFLDLSEAGRQPMCNENETVWIVLNGEIYNYIELRKTLLQLGHQFKTNSDTEVIIHGYEEWGTEIVNKLKGMFAFGLLDLKRDKLILVRDRFGIKPLYYTNFDGQFVFASELKAIVAHREVKREMDMSAFADYFVYRYIPSPKTIWKNISKLPPAHLLIYDYKKQSLSTGEYWKLNFNQSGCNNINLAEEVGSMIEESIKIHARSDVPVGSFLSGGYDSSAVVYYLKKAGYVPDTFAIGFEGWENSEHFYSEKVAIHLGVPLHSLIVNDQNLNLLDIMPDVYDEPIADISILPTWLVSNNAVKNVKAVMSGEGADELFVGYTWQKEFFKKNESQSILDKIKSFYSGVENENVAFYANAMAMGRFDNSELKKMISPALHEHINGDADWFYRKNYDASLSPLKRIQQMDVKCFMGELVLTKVDRASMANSLEVRVPFLDHEIYDKVLSYKESCYYKATETKHLLYQNIKNHLPEEILHRKKQGFVGPDLFYMNIEWYKSILKDSSLIRDGLIRKEYYTNLVAKKDHWRLWKLVVIEKWYQRWIV